MTGELILLRHGNSEWNQKNLFTGWVDVDLSEQGRNEAIRAGQLMQEFNLLPTILFTSVLKRAINTAHISLDQMSRNWIETHRDWRLNERHYGALQGKDKAQTLSEFGAEQFQLWRRSYDVPPPPMPDDSEFSQAHDERYQKLSAGELPRTECLKDVLERLLPYWRDVIAPKVLQGEMVLIVAHGNSLRALVKHLDGLSNEAVVELNIPTGIPLRYQLDHNLKPKTKGGEYLDPEAAAAGAAAVASQGTGR